VKNKGNDIAVGTKTAYNSVSFLSNQRLSGNFFVLSFGTQEKCLFHIINITIIWFLRYFLYICIRNGIYE